MTRLTFYQFKFKLDQPHACLTILDPAKSVTVLQPMLDSTSSFYSQVWLLIMSRGYFLTSGQDIFTNPPLMPCLFWERREESEGPSTVLTFLIPWVEVHYEPEEYYITDKTTWMPLCHPWFMSLESSFGYALRFPGARCVCTCRFWWMRVWSVKGNGFGRWPFSSAEIASESVC